MKVSGRAGILLLALVALVSSGYSTSPEQIHIAATGRPIKSCIF